jgi:PBSX family phage terminase large subunit
MLSWAVLYPGEYLVCRQFAPELKMTTYKTFLDICPPELIEEHRVADALIKIKAVGGKFSTIYFRQLEEPEKLRSLNLSGFYIDEANQVSEEAFMLLQGRLRGGGIRKGILTTNPKGHDWIYRWFFAKDHMKDPVVKTQYHLIKAPSTENIHLPDGYLQSVMASWDEARIQREIQGSFDAFEGQVYSDFRRDAHVVRPFRIPSNWERHIRIDHGYRNPAAALFFAVSPEGECYVYREIYVREWLIKEIILGNKKENKSGVVDFVRGDTKFFKTARIDPSTKANRGRGDSDYEEYRRHWPDNLPPLQFAKNDVQVGIDRVKSYLKPDPKTNKPMLYIFETCTNLLEEITTYRYPDLKPNQQGVKNEDEKPIKCDDHALDALRYMVVDLPERYKAVVEELDRHKKYTNIEIAMQDEFKRLTSPKDGKDPFSDGI